MKSLVAFLLVVLLKQCFSTYILIEPWKELSLEIVPGSQMSFEAAGMEPSSAYEVKISYPATFPVEMRLDIPRVPGRTLLDVEKSIFHTDCYGNIESSMPRNIIHLTSSWRGYSSDPTASSIPVPYNIKPLFLGVPMSVLPLVCSVSAVFGILLGVFSCYVLPQIESKPKED